MMVGVIQPRGWVSDADREKILAALVEREHARTAEALATAKLRTAVQTASANGASVRELAALTRLSPSTIQTWRDNA